jgi:uncharacterized repeat protein (TIGR04138 family)
MQQIQSFEGEVQKIVDKDPRFHREAYSFVRQALEVCQKKLLKSGRKVGADNHVSVAELLDGIRSHALDEYGPMAITLLNSWGVHKSEDFGDIVFNMAEQGLFRTTESDTREEFKKGFDFQGAFVAPFKPGKKMEKPTAEPSAK